MIRGVMATFSKGVLIPQESLDLEEGEKVVLSISAAPAERSLVALKATAGAWKGTNDPDALKQDIYFDRGKASRPQPKL